MLPAVNSRNAFCLSKPSFPFTEMYNDKGVPVGADAKIAPKWCSVNMFQELHLKDAMTLTIPVAIAKNA